MSTQVLGDWHWVKTPSEQEKSEYNEMCMILMIKLKGKSLREHTENELNNVAEFLDAIIKLIESYPQEQMFKKDAKKMLILRMKTNYLLHHYNKAEKIVCRYYVCWRQKRNHLHTTTRSTVELGLCWVQVSL